MRNDFNSQVEIQTGIQVKVEQLPIGVAAIYGVLKQYPFILISNTMTPNQKSAAYRKMQEHRNNYPSKTFVLTIDEVLMSRGN